MASMEQLFRALKQAQAKTFGPPKEILGMVHEWKGKGENVLKSLADCIADIESREKKLSLVGESLEKRLKDLEVREREFESFRERKKRDLALKKRSLSPTFEDFAKEIKLKEEKLDEQLKLVHEHIESLEVAHSEVEGLRLRECEKLKEIENREREVDFIHGSLKKRLRDVEQREKEIYSFRDGKLRELAMEEEILDMKKEEFVKEVKLANQKFSEKEKTACGLIERLELALDMLNSMKVTIDAKFKEIESWEAMAHKSLSASLNEANLIQESLEKRIREFEKLENEFNTSQEEKVRKMEEKEYQLSIKRKEIRKEIRLRDEKLIELQKLGRQLVESFEEMVAVKLKEIESQKLTLHVACEKSDARAKDADFKMESANIRLQELEKREEKFRLYHQKKVRELVVAEEKLRLIGEEFLQSVKFREDEFDKQEKLVHGLLRRLEMALNNVRDMNALVRKRFKEVELNNIKNQCEKKIDELDYNARELGGQKKGTKAKGDCLNFKKSELEGKKMKLGLKEQKVGTHFKECESKRHQLTDALDANIKIEPEESLHLKTTVQMDVITLQKLTNDTEKDFDLMADEVFKVLLLSPDPAKLVLHEIEGFCRSHLGRRDVELNKRRMVILLLDQLIKMSAKIQDCVRGDAIDLASEWKSKMRTTAEYSLEVLGFLHLLAAYNLTSYFHKGEVLSLLKMVAQHERTPELWRILGLTEDVPGFIQNLIIEKQYLLASTYIYECELEYMFPQGAVLDYYLKHSKMLAKAKCKMEHNSSEAQDKAIVREIADLHLAIEHIVKYGLESECSPNILTERVKQLERDRARLRNIMPSSSTDLQKQEKCRESDQPMDVNKRKATRRNVDQAPVTPPSHAHKRLRTSNIHHRLRR